MALIEHYAIISNLPLQYFPRLAVQTQDRERMPHIGANAVRMAERRAAEHMFRRLIPLGFAPLNIRCQEDAIPPNHRR